MTIFSFYLVKEDKKRYKFIYLAKKERKFLMTYPPLEVTLRQKLIDAATQVVAHSYAPYSKFHVGAALLSASGSVFTGTNIENISYGLTMCAERVAIGNAITHEGPHLRIRAIALACATPMLLTPCGACRQALQEFGRDATVMYPTSHGFTETSLANLLPTAFEEFVPSQEGGHVIRIHGNV